MCGGSTGIRQIYFLLLVKPLLQAAIWKVPSGLGSTPEVTFSFSAPILGVGFFWRRKVHNLLPSLHSMSAFGSSTFSSGLLIFSLLQGEGSAPTPWFYVQFLRFYDQNWSSWPVLGGAFQYWNLHKCKRFPVSFAFQVFICDISLESWIGMMLSSKTPCSSCKSSVFW